MDREDYTSVSDIIKPYTHYKHEKDNKRMIRGMRVHEAIDSWMKGKEYLLFDHEEEMFLASFKKWWDQESLELVESELMLYDDFLEVKGRVDAVVRVPGSNKLMLVDYKTSIWADKPVWRLQGGWYHRLLTKNKYPMAPRMLFVQLLPNGDMAYNHIYRYDHELFDCMIGALKLAKYFKVETRINIVNTQEDIEKYLQV